MGKQRRPRLAIDMDEVIADAHAGQEAWYRAEHGYVWSEEELRGNALQSLVSPDHAVLMQEVLHDGKIFGTFPVMAGSQEALSILSDRFDIFIVTAAMEYPGSCAAKFSWLQENFPFISPLNIVFCGDKSIVSADILIDDSVRHFDKFTGQGVLFTAPHNLTVDWPHRVTSWDDALAFLRDWQSGS